MNEDRLKQLKIQLRDRALNKRKEALDALASMPSEVALPILQQLFQESDFALRRFAVMGLGNHLTEESLIVLQNILTQEKDPNVLAEAANSIYEFGDRSIPILQNLFITSDNWLVHQTVIALLVDSKNYAILLEIIKLGLADDDQTTKETAILSLSQLIDTEYKQQAFDLFAVLAEDDFWRTRWRTAIALSASQDLPAKQLLARLQQDEHYRVVAGALSKG